MKEGVKNALNNKKDLVLDGRHLRLSKSDHKEVDYKTTLFVGNLPYVTDEEELRDHF